MSYRPPRGEPSVSFHASLNVRPERYRKLRLVHTIDPALFSDIISDCWYRSSACAHTTDHTSGVEGSVPGESLGVNDEDEHTGERLTVPCDPFFSIVPLPLARAEDIERYVGSFASKYHWSDLVQVCSSGLTCFPWKAFAVF